MADASVVINEAAAGVKNLETVWKSVEAYVENSIEQLKDVDNSSLLLQFFSRIFYTSHFDIHFSLGFFKQCYKLRCNIPHL